MMITHKSVQIFVLLFLIMNVLANKSARAQYSPNRASSEVTELQASIIATLTGYNDQDRRTARTTPHERKKVSEFLERTFEKLNLTPLIQDYKMPNVNGFVDLLLAPYKGQNVYSILTSTASNKEYVLVGAHYDSEPNTPGAIDNASGVAVTYSLANLISQQEYRAYNYIFVLFDQEEDDEVGSMAFAQFLKEKPYKIHSTHIIDSIGWGDSDTLAFEVQVSDSFTGNMYRKTASFLNISLNVIGGRGASDNKSFNLSGYHSAGFWDEELSPNIHKPSDTFETINFDRLELATHFMFQLLMNLDSSYDEI